MALGTLAMLVINLTACDKEAIPEPIDKVQEVPEAAFKKQLSLNQPDGNSILMEVGASDQALLDRIEPSHFTVDLNVSDTHADEEGHACTQGHAGEGSHEDAKASPCAPLPSRYITVQVLGAYSEKEIQSYAIHFSASMQDMMRREKLGMRVILTDTAYVPTALPTGKTAGWWKITRACVRMRLNGDGGQIKTLAQTFRADLNGSTWVRGNALHNPPLEFLNYTYCKKCNHSGVSRIKDVYVIRDVLSSVWIFDTCI